jgi:hypothetical protein
VPRRPAGQARRSITPAPRQAHSSAPGTWHPARWAGLRGVVRDHAAQVPACPRIPARNRQSGGRSARRLAGALRLGPDRAIRGSGAGPQRRPPRCPGLALPSRCCAPSPQAALQAAALLIARRQETQAGGADLGQLRPHFGYTEGTSQVQPSCRLQRRPLGQSHHRHGSRLRIVTTIGASFRPELRTTGSVSLAACYDHFRSGLDLWVPMFAPCLLGCRGTPRQRPVLRGIGFQELPHNSAPHDMTRHYPAWQNWQSSGLLIRGCGNAGQQLPRGTRQHA